MYFQKLNIDDIFYIFQQQSCTFQSYSDVEYDIPKFLVESTIAGILNI